MLSITNNQKTGKIDNKTIKNIARNHGINVKNKNEVKILIEKYDQKIKSLKYEIVKHENRKEYNKANYIYELNRGYFYRNLKPKIVPNQNLTNDVLENYWSKYWDKNENENENRDYINLIKKCESKDDFV